MASTLARPRVIAATRALLVGDATLSGLLGGAFIYSEGDVPAGKAAPYVTVLADEVPNNTMGANDADLKWGSVVTLQMKVLSAKPNPSEADAVLERMLALLNGKTHTVAGYGIAWFEFEQALSPYTELVAGAPVKHLPSIWRVTVHQQG